MGVSDDIYVSKMVTAPPQKRDIGCICATKDVTMTLPDKSSRSYSLQHYIHPKWFLYFVPLPIYGAVLCGSLTLLYTSEVGLRTNFESGIPTNCSFNIGENKLLINLQEKSHSFFLYNSIIQILLSRCRPKTAFY